MENILFNKETLFKQSCKLSLKLSQEEALFSNWSLAKGKQIKNGGRKMSNKKELLNQGELEITTVREFVSIEETIVFVI